MPHKNLINHEKLQVILQKLWDAAKKKFAKLDEDNVFTGKNEFYNGIVKNAKVLNSVVNTNLSQIMNNHQYFVTKNVYADVDQYVERLVVGIHDSIPIGTVIENKIRVFVVDYNTGEVLSEPINFNQSFTVINYNGGDLESINRVIELPIKDTFDKKVTFGIESRQGNCVAWGNNGIQAMTSAGDTSDGRTQVGQFIRDYGSGEGKWTGAVKVIGGDVAFKDLVNSHTNLNDYVHKTKENFVTGKTVFTDGYTASKIYTLNNEGTVSSMGENAFFSSKEMRVPRGTLLSKVTIGVDSSYAVGDTVTNVKVAIVDSSNRVQKYIVNNKTAIVHENRESSLTNCTRAITIDINEKWDDEDKTLLVGAKGALWGRRTGNNGGDTIADNTAPTESFQLSYSTSDDKYNGKVIMYGNDLSMSKLVKDVTYADNTLTVTKVDGTSQPYTITSGGGTVTSVNGVQPQQGGVITLTTTPTFEQNSLKLKTGQVEFTSIPCYTQEDSAALLAELDRL